MTYGRGGGGIRREPGCLIGTNTRVVTPPAVLRVWPACRGPRSRTPRDPARCDLMRRVLSLPGGFDFGEDPVEIVGATVDVVDHPPEEGAGGAVLGDVAELGGHQVGGVEAPQPGGERIPRLPAEPHADLIRALIDLRSPAPVGVEADVGGGGAP